MCEKLSKSPPLRLKDRQMEMEQKAIGGEKGVDEGALCFEPIDGVKDHEILEPIWSELDVFGSGTLNGLLSSDVHDGGDGAETDDREHGHIPGTEAFDLLKVKEEFAQHGGPEIPHTQIDAHAASLGGVVNIHDYFAIRDIPQNNTEAPYGSHENLVFHGSSFQMKEELLSEELEKASVGLDIANGNAQCRVQREEQYISEADQTEESLSHEEELKLRLVGVDTVNSSSELPVNAYELHVPQLPGEDNKEVSHGMEREMLVVVKTETNKIVANQVGETGADANAGPNGSLVGQDDDQVDSDAGVSEVDKVNRVMHEDDQEESDVPGSELDDEEINDDRAYTMADIQQQKSSPKFISEMLRDGCLSAEGLASKGFIFMDDNESDSGEDSADSSDDEEDEESDVVSSKDSEEDVKEIKSRVKTKKKEDAEETGPPRTKHELDVLPPVPKVTAVLEPHHTPVSVGHISSVLDLTVIVESSGTERILNENSILWLTEPRIPLGIVDEVFGPVKNPFYLVRFNDLSEIPEDAKTGADVSYVSEFSEFVLKDNPSLYRKAVDASGLDDEELASDEDLEFSDDEKEAAARMREKSKRALDNRGENRQGSQDWKSAADGQHSKGQRTERGRGRGRGGGRGAAVTENAVDSAADFVAGMDLQGSPWHPTQRFGGKQQSGRRWNNRGRQSSSPRNSGNHQEMQTRSVRTGPVDGQTSSFQQHQESPQRRDGLYFAEQQANSQMHSQQVLRQAGGMQGIPFNAGAAIPGHHLQGHRRDAGLYFAEQSNSSQMHSQQVQRQVGGSMQGIPFNAGALPAHLQGQGVVPGQQQPATGFQAYGYHHQVPVYDAQFGIPRQGNIFSSVPGGPQLMQNTMVFGNPNLPPNPYFNQGQGGQMSMINSQGYGNLVHAGQLNFGVPVHQRSLGDATQAGVHPSLTSLMAPSSVLGSSGAVARDHRGPRSVPQNNQNQGGPVGGARASRNNGQRGHSSGRQRKGYPHNKDSRG